MSCNNEVGFDLTPMLNVEDIRRVFKRQIVVRKNGMKETLKNDLTLDQAIALIKADRDIIQNGIASELKSSNENIPEGGMIKIYTIVNSGGNPTLLNTSINLFNDLGTFKETIGTANYELYNYKEPAYEINNKITSQIKTIDISIK